MASKISPSVLMFGWEFPPYNSGGLGVACEGMSKALSASGVNLTFALPYKVPIKASWCKFVFADEEVDFKTSKEVMNYVSGYTSHTSTKSTNHLINKISGLKGNSLMERVFLYAKKAPNIASKSVHSIIHAHDWLTYPAGIEAKKFSKRPLISHIHATEYDRSGETINRDIFEIEKEGFHKSDMIVAVSGRTRKSVIEKYGIDPDKVKVVHNGVDFVETNENLPHNLEVLKSRGYSIVLFVGRITFQKGPDYFVNMAEKVLKFEPKTFFVVSGSGDMEDQMIREVSKKGITNNFLFCGFLRGKELNGVFRAADIFVMPSVSEPFGIVPLEAMLANTPVLISKESGVSEVISCALKSNFWDVDDMTDKAVSVLRNKKLHRQLSLSGKKEVKTIHWKKAADSLISLYNSLEESNKVVEFVPSPIFAIA